MPFVLSDLITALRSTSYFAGSVSPISRLKPPTSPLAFGKAASGEVDDASDALDGLVIFNSRGDGLMPSVARSLTPDEHQMAQRIVDSFNVNLRSGFVRIVRGPGGSLGPALMQEVTTGTVVAVKP